MVARAFTKAAAHKRISRAAALPANVWEPDPAPGDIPAECQTDATRVTMCQAGSVWGNILNKDGQIVGRADLNVMFGAAVSNKLTWKVNTKAVVASATGQALAGTIDAVAQCSGACKVAAGISKPLPLRADAFMRGSWDITSTTPGASPVTSIQSVLFKFLAPTTLNAGQAVTPGIGKVRCDNGATLGPVGAGCVYPDITPVLYLSGAAHPASPVHSAFVASAQASGKPGAPSGAPLHRESNAAKVKANRTAACKGFVLNPSPPGTPADSKDSCDEYPFAGTKEGGPASATAHVPVRDNSNGGTKYSTFILQQRLWENDAFFVYAVA